MNAIEYITDLLLAGRTQDARNEIAAEHEQAKILNKVCRLNVLETRDLLEACDIIELT